MTCGSTVLPGVPGFLSYWEPWRSRLLKPSDLRISSPIIVTPIVASPVSAPALLSRCCMSVTAVGAWSN